MSSLTATPEYLSHATLMVLGTSLDPADVSSALGLRPTQAWMRGDTHKWGGWKKSLPASQTNKPLPSQLRFWIRTLRGRAKAISKLVATGHLCTLDCYIGTASTASIIVPADLQSELAALGLELRLSVFANGG
jgi:hypothetical protein